MKIENIFRYFIFVLLGVIVYYSFKCIIPRIKIKENLTEENKKQYCDPFFTAPGTEVTINPLGVSNYLTIDPNSSINNIILGTISSNWSFERIIEEKVIRKNKSGTYNNFSKPNRCSLYIKTEYKYDTENKKDSPKLHYYLTLNGKKNFEPGSGENYVSGSLFGNGAKQVWYTIDISSLSQDGPYSNIVQYVKGMENENTRYVFIITNPIAFEENKENSKTRFLTADINTNNKNSIGSVTIKPSPTEYSIWQINYIKKGTIKPLPDYKPSLSISEYPNNHTKNHGTFMNTFLPIWNRTWYSSDDNETIKSFTIHLCSPWYKITEKGEYTVKNTVATGTIVFDTTYSDGLANKTYDVKSQGSDTLIGFDSNGDSHIIIKMIQKNDLPKGKTLPKGIPLLQGWVIGKDGNKISLCATKEKNFSGMCLSLNKPNSFQKYLLKKDFLPINQDTNISLSNNFVETFVQDKKSECVGNLTKLIC